MEIKHEFMSAADIARELNCTRANANQTIKRALRKVYKGILKEKIADNPFDALQFMSDYLGMETQEDINELFKILPEDIKEKVKNNAPGHM